MLFINWDVNINNPAQAEELHALGNADASESARTAGTRGDWRAPSLDASFFVGVIQNSCGLFVGTGKAGGEETSQVYSWLCWVTLSRGFPHFLQSLLCCRATLYSLWEG